jgi:electron transport complex protein RnfB
MANIAGPTPAQLDLARRIDALLPQTQCTRCGYPDCAAYALAIARSEAAINQCPPGGADGVSRLALVTQRPDLPLNPSFGVEAPRTVAVIDEAWCIGCTLCINACPTDAIVGSNKQMHTVIESACTGCDLCLPVCPVDCIQMVSVSAEHTGWAAWSTDQADTARQRYTHRQQRLQQKEQAQQSHLVAKAQAHLQDLESHTKVPDGAGKTAELDRKRSIIEAAIASALAKAKARQAGKA